MCFLGECVAFRRGLCLGCKRVNGVSPTARRLVGAGVTGDCNLFALRLGGIKAGVSLKVDTFEGGDGRLSRMGCRAEVMSRRFML